MTPTDLQKPPTETEIADIARLPDPISGVIRRLAFQRDTLIARVRELEAGLTWTDAKPTVPGWYWYRIRDSFPSRIVELRNLKHGGNVEIYVIGHGLLDSHVGQFAGPIPQPEEPHADPR